MSRRSRSASYLRSLETLNLGLRASRLQEPPPRLQARPSPRGGSSPQGLLPAPQIVLQDDAGHRAALTHTRAISDEEARALPAGEQDLMLLRGWGKGVQRATGSGWALRLSPRRTQTRLETPGSPDRRR